MAEWLGSALQKLLQRFESASDLQPNKNPKHKLGVFLLAKLNQKRIWRARQFAVTCFVQPLPLIMDNFDTTTWMVLITAYLAIVIPIVIIAIVAMWRIFTKAGQPGWAVLIPFYNLYVLTQVAKRPGWWMLLYFASFIPVIGALGVLFVSIIDNLRLAKLFGKSAGFGVGMILLGIVFLPILAFGDADYDETRVREGELV